MEVDSQPHGETLPNQNSSTSSLHRGDLLIPKQRLSTSKLQTEELRRQNSFVMAGLSKSGYLEVKQPSNIKGRKLKTWKRKWVVVHKMTDLAAGTFAAKFLLYNTEDEAEKQLTNDRQAYIFDHVTAVEPAKSKTRPLAFQIVQEAPTLMLSGATGIETDDWIKSLKELFWPEENKPPGDTFQVTIEENEDSNTWSLAGDYWLTVSPEIITIKSFEDNSIHEWNLNFIKRFFMDKSDVNVLIIETGSISEFGEAHFRFRSTMVPEILGVIRKNIQEAVKLRTVRKRAEDSGSCSIVQGNSSVSGNKSFQTLLCRSPLEDSSVVSVSAVSNTSFESESSSTTNDYSVLNNSLTRDNTVNIVATTVVNVENGNNVEVKFDQSGYSHIAQTSLEAVPDVDTKARSISGCVSNDEEIPRSTSICSNDSGIAHVTNESNANEVKRGKHKSNNSFDSGISTSSLKPEINASISGIFVTSEMEGPVNQSSFVPYSKIIESSSNTPEISPKTKVNEQSNYSSIYWDLDANENTERQTMIEMENQYEDLDKYRKNLSKHLGFDPRINPVEVPPSLPERPSTLPTRRRERTKSTKRKDKKIPKIQDMLKTVTRARAESISSTSSTTSEGDDDKVRNTPLSNRKKWPLARSSTAGNNELYTSVPNEGVFTSIRPRARSYEDKSAMFDDSVLSVQKWPMNMSANSGFNSGVTVYEPIYSQVSRSSLRNRSSSDFTVQNSNGVSQVDMDLLTGDLNDDLSLKHSAILQPEQISPEEMDFIDFSSEISVPQLETLADITMATEDAEGGDVWNPFPKIADFTNIIKTEFEDENEQTVELSGTDPFDIFHIGVVSNRLGLSVSSSALQDSSQSVADKTLNEDIYMDMSSKVSENTVEYVLPSDVSRT